MEVIETQDLVDQLILERVNYIIVTKNDLTTFFGKFFKVNNTFINDTTLALTLVLEEHTGKYKDILFNDIMSIEMLKKYKKFKVVL